MKIISIILTILLIIPIVPFLSSFAVSVEPGFHTPVFTVLAWQSFRLVLIYFLFFCVAVYLHLKALFRENSIMCGTLIVAYLLFTILNVIGLFILHG
ncbi:hypothetical protein [Mucilaginibacter frigoritolerans]|jgi:hypothetical protein|uniref:hypothetical protein n=1 Tax=Mucilaginibacter frigoritolerans TaxID=652788 RepID=UPI0011A2D53D|nr:hypothetical protein [Mucilaginibacter frigoritolerans]